MKRLIISFLLVKFALPFSFGFELPLKTERSFEWEFYNNASNDINERKAHKIDIYHYEVPIKYIKKEFHYKDNCSIEKALFFKKIHKEVETEFIRWIINPEDQVYHLKVREMLQRGGYDATPKHYFKGYLTSSRSIYIRVPTTNYIFSVKVSTSHTGGCWKNKKYVYDRLLKSVKWSGWQVFNYHTSRVNSNLLILTEPFAFRLEGDEENPLEVIRKEVYECSERKIVEIKEQGMIIRDVSLLTNNKNYYLPGFSAFEQNLGLEIAKINGSNNALRFWIDNLVKPLAWANAHFLVETGLVLTSPHLQQFLIELDSKLKPTGKIIFRDYGDSNPISLFFLDADDQEWKVITKMYQVRNVFPKLVIMFGLFHGLIKFPTWFNYKEEISRIKEIYYKSFEEKFCQLTNVPLSEFNNFKIIKDKYRRYTYKEYKVTYNILKKFLQNRRLEYMEK